jgi:hypothetical protein
MSRATTENSHDVFGGNLEMIGIDEKKKDMVNHN